MERNLYIIAGCNGAGKTTASYTILPEILDCREFVNADEIAKGLSPFQPEKVAVESGRIMLQRVKELLAEGEDFAFETTLATRSYSTTVKKAKEEGYNVVLLFFWLQKVELAIERVKSRVAEGGHNIPEEVIRRRYLRGIKNLFDIYFPLVDVVYIFDNSEGRHELIAEKIDGKKLTLLNKIKFSLLKSYHDQ
jgi:predicted ABC-type ATPase